jgi:hypothetical protein
LKKLGKKVDSTPLAAAAAAVAARFGQGNVAEARSLVDQCRADDPDTLCNQACILYGPFLVPCTFR